MHAAAKAIADSQGMEIAEWCEQVLGGVIRKRVMEANLVITTLEQSGALGMFRDSGGLT